MAKKQQYRFNVKRFVSDLGGVHECVAKLRCDRTSVYKWLKKGTMDMKYLVRAKSAEIGLIDKYFEAV